MLQCLQSQFGFDLASFLKTFASRKIDRYRLASCRTIRTQMDFSLAVVWESISLLQASTLVAWNTQTLAMTNTFLKVYPKMASALNFLEMRPLQFKAL